MSTTMKQRMEELMKKKNLSASELLMKIHDMLYPEQHRERYEFCEKNKANFSKMISGARPFKFEYVVPLERILNTTMDYIVNGEESNVGIQLRNKGIEYTAYLNNYDEYVKFGAETDSEGHLIIANYDEYNKNLLNYIIEYQSEQGIAYLYDHFGFRYSAMHGAFNCEPHIYIHKQDEQLMILKLLALKGETVLLYNIINPYQRIEYDWERDDNLLKSKDFRDLLLTSGDVLKEFLDDATIGLTYANRNLVSSKYSFDQCMFINPMLQDILAFALDNPQYYATAIHNILDFGIAYNKRMLGFAAENFSSFAQELKVDEKGYIVDGWAKIGSILTYDRAVDPEINNAIKEKIKTLVAQKNALLNLEQPSVMADTITADGKYIWRQASENDVEYEMYKLCEKLEIHEIPKYYETREGLDRLDYISGSVLRHCGNANYNQVASLVSWLKKYQDKLGDALGGKVYVHGALDNDAVLFENDEIKGIVNWQYCGVGEKHEDFVDILINWLDIGSSMRKNDVIYSTIVKLLNEYGATEEMRNNLPSLMKEELERRIHSLDKEAWNYEYWYEYYRHAQTFLELYGERIKKEALN